MKYKNSSPAGTRTRVAWVKTTYPDQLDYWGAIVLLNWNPQNETTSENSSLHNITNKKLLPQPGLEPGSRG